MLSDNQIDQLKRLKELLDQGILTQAEFDDKKTMILNAMGTVAESPLQSTSEEDSGTEKDQETEIRQIKNLADEGDSGPINFGSNETEKFEPNSENDKTNQNSQSGSYYAGSTNTPDVKKPFYKKKRFVIPIAILLFLLVLGSFGSGSGDGTKTTSSNSSTSTESSQTNSGKNSKTTEASEAKKEISSIGADYSGNTEAGTVLDANNKGIIITANYGDGDSEKVTGWTIAEPQTLAAGQSSTVTIEYKGKTCDLTVDCTTVDEASYKESCETIAYEELARNPDTYKWKKLVMTGKVIQVLEDNNSKSINLRIATKGDYDDVVLVTYEYKEGESRILEDDNITIWGLYGGTYTYESVLGGDITVPYMMAEYLQRN